MAFIADIFKNVTNDRVDISLTTSMVNNTLWGIVGSSGTQLQARYGKGVRENKTTGLVSTYTTSPKLCLQKTNVAKRVRVQGYLNSVLVEEGQFYMRIWRELSWPQVYGSNLYCTPGELAPLGVQEDDLGSIGYGPSAQWASGVGAQQIWWLLWETPTGYRAALCDAGPVGVGAYPAGKIPKDGKFGAMFRTNGLAVFHSTTNGDWSTGKGLRVYEDDSAIIYYIADVGASLADASTALSQKPFYSQPRQVYQYPNVIWDETASPTANTPVTGVNPQEPAAYVWSGIRFSQNGRPPYVPVALRGTEQLALEQALLRATDGPPAAPSISPTQSAANYVQGNLRLTREPSAPQNVGYWYPKYSNAEGKYLATVVVNGNDLATTGSGFDPNNPNSYAFSIDNQWVSGQVGPALYWYVLPDVYRAKKDNCCTNSTGTISPALAFSQPNNTCMYGRHFGKFLKSAYTQAEVQKWANYMEAAAERVQSTSQSDIKYTGYISASAPDRPPYAKTFIPVEFQIKKIPAFGGVAEGYLPTTGSGATASATVPVIDSTLLTKLNGYFTTSGSSVITSNWTLDQLKKVAASQATVLGRSLSDIKEEFLLSILTAKVAWIQKTKNLPKDQATKEAEEDPVYKSLSLYFQSLSGASSTAFTGSGGGGGGSGGSTGSGSTPNAPRGGGQNAKNQTKTIQITRGFAGYQTGIRQTSTFGADAKPELVQTYNYFQRQQDGTEVAITANERFVFPFVPREVNYSGIGAKWSEIERTGNYPLVDWSGFQLLKISFSFDVVDNTYKNRSGYGLYFSCEDEIAKLRRMAQAPFPVTFLNLDKFVTEEVRYPVLTQARGIEFVIAEFSVTAVQRTPPTTVTSDSPAPHQISRATCNMTLQEVPVERIDIVQMPPIRPCPPKVCPEKSIITEENLRQFLLWTSAPVRKV